MAIGHKLSVRRQILEGIGFQAAVVTLQVIKDRGFNTIKPPLIQPSPICGFSVNSATRSPQNTNPPKRAAGLTAVTVAMRPCAR